MTTDPDPAPDEPAADSAPAASSADDQAAGDAGPGVGGAWWGTFDLADGEMGRWEIGPRTLWLYHTAYEWRVFARAGTDSLQAGSTVACPLSDADRDAVLDGTEPTDTVHRFSFRRTTETVSLRPALADRPVVVRPEDPLSVPSGEEVTLFVSTPLWIQILLGERDKPVHEVPAHRPSDTWFGRSTREGELCYAARTAGRLQLDDLPQRYHRAVTPLRVRNDADDVLPVERVQIPTQYLALYRAAGGFLWTQSITMKRSRAGEGAQVDVVDGPPSVVPDADRLGDPRHKSKEGLVVGTFRALEALFGHG